MFGFGDQKKYSDRYVSAMGTLYDSLVDKGARVIGQWSTDGYEFEQSGAVREGQFVGLALDDKNQAMLTNDRITEWLELIKPQLIA